MTVLSEIFLEGGDDDLLSRTQTLACYNAWPCFYHVDHDRWFECAVAHWFREHRVKLVKGGNLLPCFPDGRIAKWVLRAIGGLRCGHSELVANPRKQFDYSWAAAMQV